MLSPPRTRPRTSESYLSQKNREWTLLLSWGSTFGTWSYPVDNWGVSVSPMGYPLAFIDPWHGFRFNTELLTPADPYWTTVDYPNVQPRIPNNIQTFLIVEGPGDDAIPMDLGNPEVYVAMKANSLSKGSKAVKIHSAWLKEFALYQKKGKKK